MALPGLIQTYAYINRGNAHSDKGDYDRAIADCDKARQIDPSLDC